MATKNAREKTVLSVIHSVICKAFPCRHFLNHNKQTMGMCYAKPIPTKEELQNDMNLAYARIRLLERETLTASMSFDPLGQIQRRQAGIDLRELHDHLDKIKVVGRRLGIKME